MKQRPILFKGEMVRAILDGSKTQTRRNVRLPNGYEWLNKKTGTMINDGGHRKHISELICKCGKVGDQLWVRETWQTHCDKDAISPCDLPHDSYVQYPATYDAWKSKLRPSIFMPRWASRITLEIASIRIERLNDISEEDAKNEGVMQIGNRDFERPEERDFKICSCCGGTGLYTYISENGASPDTDCTKCATHKKLFKNLWESINGIDSWHINPWVWVIEFKRVI